MASHIMSWAEVREYSGPSLVALLRELAQDIDDGPESLVSITAITPFYNQADELYGLIVVEERLGEAVDKLFKEGETK